ncbi:MAG: FctA domain-containing protein, partial [Clostridia bacterium]|nr:FctA domain-containing protein [Clostridia bacterium]
MNRRTGKLSAFIAVLLTVILLVAGAAAANNERDGSKIEGVTIFWLTDDSATTAEGEATPADELSDKAHLYLSAPTDDPLSMKFQVEVQLSGQYDYEPGEITITIPARIWHGREIDPSGDGTAAGGLIGGMDLSVPKAPKTNGEFNWQLINGNYVLTNTRTIGATSALMFQFSVNDVLPHELVDMSESEFLQAHVEVVTNQGHIIDYDSNRINAQVDTIETITSDVKACKFYESYADTKGAVPASLLANLPAGADPDEYVYVRWYTYVYHKGSQPFSLDMEDTLMDAYYLNESGNKVTATGGILLGSENIPADQEITPVSPDADYAAGVTENLYHEDTTESYDHAVYLWSAYKKSDMPPDPDGGDIHYYMENHVVWTLTETDAAVADANRGKGEDLKKVTTAEADAKAIYSPITWRAPGNPNFGIGKYTERKYALNDSITKDYPYGYGLNQLLMDREVEMHFELETRGFGWQLTSDKTFDTAAGRPKTDAEIAALDLTEDDFGKLGWRQVTTDYQTFFNFGTTPLTAEDFSIRSLRVEKPKVTYAYYGDYSQTSEDDVPPQHKAETLGTPDLEVWYSQDDGKSWTLAAVAVWGTDGTGPMEFKKVASGVTTAENIVTFPDNTTDVRTAFTSNVYDGKSVDNCRLAGVVWSVYPTVMLKPSDSNKEIAAELFDQSDAPETKFKNDVSMDAYGWVTSPEDGGHQVVSGAFDTSRATIAGAGYGVSLTKKIRFDSRSVSEGGDNDVDNQRAILHYSADMLQKSNLSVRSEYDEAVAADVIPAQTSGVWYDLLPEGVAPVLDTVALRAGDAITGLYTVEDYRGTGRTLLVVLADLKPAVTMSKDGNGYQDTISISFDAVYSWEDMKDLGETVENYIAFETTVDTLANDTLGTFKGQQGEPDDPRGGMNTLTPTMPDDIAAAMTGLDPNTAAGANRFVYGKVRTTLDLNTYAVTGVRKDVSDDMDGMWTQGLDEQTQVTVYEGHGYTYRLRAASSETTRTSNIVLFDTIENYHIPASDASKTSDYNDIQAKKDFSGDWEGKGQWRGTLVSVDVSDMISAGIAPVVYYATLDDLQFADSTPGMTYDEQTALFKSGYYDLTNSAWKKASVDADGNWTVPDGVNVTAIAIDAGTAKDGSPFILQPGKAVNAYLHMVAPDDEGDPDTWHAKGAYAHVTDGEVDWEKALDKENNMYAFNNTRMCCEQENVNGGGTSEYRMIRNDYTRVGILPEYIEVSKIWMDNADHDKIRPENVTVTLMRKRVGSTADPEVVTDGKGAPRTVTLDETNGWKAVFLQVPLTDPDGTPFLYSFDEGTIAGYELTVARRAADQYVLTNRHPNEQVSLKGEKIWDDDGNAANVRPASVTVYLCRDGVRMENEERAVTPDSAGKWTWDFGEKDKYDETGREYVYTVEEEYVPKYAAEADGYGKITNSYYPFGDLSIGKTVLKATDAAQGTEFTFTLTLFAELQPGQTEPEPLAGSYDYAVYSGSAADPVRTGTISTGTRFTLKADERIVVKGLPSESTYRIEEMIRDGYTQTGRTGDTGSVRVGKTAEAAFENTYKAEGGISLRATKKITGRAMKSRQFRFSIIDDTEGSPTRGDVILSSYNEEPEKTEKHAQTGEITSEGGFIFGELRYTEADVGKTFRYIVKEDKPGKSGYGYDTTEYSVFVSVSDAGDGTLIITAKLADGSDATDPQHMIFQNTYTAAGQWAPKAWKVMQGRDLEEEEFTFELYRDDPDTPIQTKKNAADGTVTFDEITFTQDDLSETDEPARITFLVKEQAGTDETVIYSETAYVYTLTLIDGGDGTISFEESITEQGKTEEVTPVFINKPEGGELQLLKKVQGEMANPNQEFTFHVKLAGEDLPDSLEYTRTDPSTAPAPAPTPGPVYPSSPSAAAAVKQPAMRDLTILTPVPLTTDAPVTPAPASVPTPDISKQYHIADSALNGKAYAMLEKDGTLTLFRADENNPRNPYGAAFNPIADGKPSVQNDIVYFTGFEEARDLNWARGDNGWASNTYNSKIKKITMAGAVKPNTTAYWFNTLNMLESVDLSMLDTSKVVYMVAMFDLTQEGVTNKVLTTLDLSTFDTSAVKNMSSMFYGCNGLTSLDLSSFDTSSATNMYMMFYGCSSMESLDVDHFDTSSAENMAYMFSGCEKLKTLDLSHFRTGNVTNMSGMFNNCAVLEYVDVSHFDTSNVTDMSYMFYFCRKLNGLDLSHFNTSKVTNMNRMFYADSSLTSLDVSHFDTSLVTNMDSMFETCVGLKSLDVSHFNTARVTNMSRMFNNCSGLTSLDVSRFNTSSVTNMSCMFEKCEKVSALDVSHFDTTNVTNMKSMFRNCFALSSLDVTGFRTGKVTDMSYMFDMCVETNSDYTSLKSNLASLDLSSFDTSNVENMQCMFRFCHKLTELDLSSFNTSKVTNISEMFRNCQGLTKVDVSSFDTSKVGTGAGGSMWYMFDNCKALTELNVNHFNVASCGNFEHMFNGCDSLTWMDLSNWDSLNGKSYSAILTKSGDWEYLNLGDLFSYDGTEPVISRARTITIGENFRIMKAIPAAPDKTELLDGNWVKIGTTDIRTNDELFTAANPGTWTWNKWSVKLTFDPNGGAGSMPDVLLPVDESYSFASSYRKPLNTLTGFDDDLSNSFDAVDGVTTIPALIYKDYVNRTNAADPTVITLTARWDPRSTTAELTEDGFIVKVLPDEVITFSLPAGTEYEVWEDTPDGWVLIEKTDDKGVIRSKETSIAKLTNEYTPGKTEAVLRALKTLDGEVPAADQFSFELAAVTDGAPMPASGEETVRNSATGSAVFGTLTFITDDLGNDDEKTFVYKITETAGNDSTLFYDANAYYAAVKVTKTAKTQAGGTAYELGSTVKYYSDEDLTQPLTTSVPAFRNTTRPGGLKVSKTVNNGTDAVADKAFTFSLKLTDAAGKPLSGKFAYEYDGNGGSGKLTVTDGSASFTLKASQTILIKELPAGAVYTLTEEALPGFKLKMINNGEEAPDGTAAGTIVSADEMEVEARNTYSVKGSAVLKAAKILNGRELTDEEFTFTLSADDGAPMPAAGGETAKNTASGEVSFGLITGFDREGTYQYRITEEAGSDKTVDYDGRTIIATVVMKDKDGKGTLTPTITYEDGEGTDKNTFVNALKPGSLEIRKTIADATEAAADQTFEFTVTFPDGIDADVVKVGAEDRQVENDKLTLKLRGGESVTISGIPAGTAYTVNETVPDAWKNTGKTGSEGTIPSAATATASFTNTYCLTGTAELKAAKILQGRALTDGEFTFTLTGLSNAPMPEEGGETAKNNASGEAAFGPITGFSKEGTYRYQIRETAGSDETVHYDDRIVNVTVIMKDADGTGTLTPTVTYEGGEGTDKNTFVNTLNPGSLEVTKTIAGATAAAADQEFGITVRFPDGISVSAVTVGTDSVTVENDTLVLKLKGGETVTVSGIPAGTEYAVTEETLPAGWENTGKSGAEGTIQAAGTMTAALTNTYSVKGTVQLKAAKSLPGRALTDGEFTFTLEAAGDAPMPEEGGETAKNNTSGEVTFGEITTFTKEGTYQYTITETAGSDDTLFYDGRTVDVTVVMEDKDGTGTLTPTVTYEGGEGTDKNTFVNTLKPGSLKITKTVINSTDAVKDKEFSFALNLTDAEGAGINGTFPTDLDGTAGTLTVTDGIAEFVLKDGETLRIDEIPALTGYTVFEETLPGFTAVLTGDTGTIEPTVTAEANAENTYAANGEWTPEVTKTMTGRDLRDGEFTFLVKDETGAVVSTGTNKTDGTIVFDAIAFTDADAGEYVFTVTEEKGDALGVTYDDTVFTVLLTADDNGEGEIVFTAAEKDGKTLNFVNPYNDETDISVTKVWTGDDGLEEYRTDITVELYESVDGGAYDKIDEKTIPADAKGADLTVTWEKLKTVRVIDGKDLPVAYTVKEVMRDKVYSGTVSGNADDGFVLTNVFSSAVWTPEASKTLKADDISLKAGDFSFRLTETAGTYDETADNDADGKVTFPAIRYTREDLGEHTYRLREVIPAEKEPGYTYDETVYTVKVTVTEEDGGIRCEAVYSNGQDDLAGADFVNSFKPTPTPTPTPTP